jgi:hypothetical protein
MPIYPSIGVLAAGIRTKVALMDCNGSAAILSFRVDAKAVGAWGIRF